LDHKAEDVIASWPCVYVLQRRERREGVQVRDLLSKIGPSFPLSLASLGLLIQQIIKKKSRAARAAFLASCQRAVTTDGCAIRSR
jgi:hypothetical protein